MSLYAAANFGRKSVTTDDILEMDPLAVQKYDTADKLEKAAKESTEAVPSLMANLMLTYTPFNEMSFGMGPIVTFKNFETNPSVGLKISAKLGGGKF